MFFLVFSYSISNTLQQMLIFLGFPIHASRGVHSCSKHRLFELSEVSVHCCFEKIATPKISAYFAYFPEKHPKQSSFQIHSQAFLGFFQNALQSSYSVENLLAPASTPGIFQNFRNMQGKARDCRIKSYDFIKRELYYINFSGYLPKYSAQQFQSNLIKASAMESRRVLRCRLQFCFYQNVTPAETIPSKFWR